MGLSAACGDTASAGGVGDGGEAWDFPSPACPAGLRVTPPRPSWSLILGNSGRHSNRSTLAAAGVESYLQEQENFKRLEYGCLKSASTLPIKPAKNNVEPQHFLDASYVLATTGSHSEPSYSAQRQRSTLLLAGVDFRLKIHIRFCRAYA